VFGLGTSGDDGIGHTDGPSRGGSVGVPTAPSARAATVLASCSRVLNSEVRLSASGVGLRQRTPSTPDDASWLLDGRRQALPARRADLTDSVIIELTEPIAPPATEVPESLATVAAAASRARASSSASSNEQPVTSHPTGEAWLPPTERRLTLVAPPRVATLEELVMQECGTAVVMPLAAEDVRREAFAWLTALNEPGREPRVERAS